MNKFLSKAFGFNPEVHKLRTEIVAGITTFLTMAYILAVNPSIFAALPGMPNGAVFTATALASLLATLVMAFYAKKPFALAPGMGLNAFFVFTVCLTMGYSWQFALTAVLLEGIIFIILTVTKVRSWLINAIPYSIKQAIGAGIGLFIAFIGLQNAGIIVDNGATLVSLGKITEGTDERSGRPRKEGKEKKEAYPKFSQFKKNVIETSINDINRLRKDGLLDVCVSYEPIYNGKRKVGNPAYIEFTIYDTIEQMQQALAKKQKAQEPASLFAAAEEVKPGEKEWRQLVGMLDGDIGEELRKVAFVSYNGKTVLLRARREQCKRVESCLSDDVIAHVKKCSKQVFGKVIAWNYSLSDN